MIYDDFNQWLSDQGYRDSTADAYTAKAKHIVACYEAGEDPPLTSTHIAAAGRLLDYLGDRNDDFSRHLARIHTHVSGMSAIQKRRYFQAQKKRQKIAHSYDESDWRTLYQVVTEGPVRERDSRALILSVMMATGIRAHDVLSITPEGFAALRDGIVRIEVKGGDERVLLAEPIDDLWGELARRLDEEDETLAGLISSNPDPQAGKAAYRALSRYLTKISDDHGLDGRPHLHRLRRTFAMRALNRTQNVLAVMKALGHKSMKTTLRYLDEQDPETIANLHGDLLDAMG